MRTPSRSPSDCWCSAPPAYLAKRCSPRDVREDGRAEARHGLEPTATLTCGIPRAFQTLMRATSASLVVNCAAMTNLAACERQAFDAYAVNARTPALLAEICLDRDIGFVQISSDHFFTGDGAALHDEHMRVRLLNEYARTKYAGEMFALTSPTALVVRTNIVGLRCWPGRPTFAEWALDGLRAAHPMTLYDDFYTSSMHSRACAEAVLDLSDAGVTGLVNVASSQVSSKLAFVNALAEASQIEIPSATISSVRELVPRRAESLGLDVTYAEQLLTRRLPDLRDTANAIVAEHRKRGLS